MKHLKPDFDKQLEARIDAELKALGELTAPATLVPRVMSAIERRAVVPWFRQSWDVWPLLPRLVSFVCLVAVFAGLCLGAWGLIHGGAGQGSGTFFGEWLPGATALFSAFGVLVDAIVLAFGHMRAEIILPVIAVFFAVWIAIVGLGTVYVRLAMQPVANRN